MRTQPILAAIVIAVPLAVGACGSTEFGGDGGSAPPNRAAEATGLGDAAGKLPDDMGGGEGEGGGGGGATAGDSPDLDDDNGSDGKDGGPEITEEKLADLCKDAARRKPLAKKITFTKPNATCEWGVNDNLPFDPANQLIITARREQAIGLDVPKGAKMCDITFDFPEADMLYDDEILLLYNGIVLMGSQDYSVIGDLQKDANGLVRYDWTKLKGKPYLINDPRQYFIDADCGLGDCSLPRTQTRGKARLKIKAETMRKVSVATKAKLNFTFVTTGDNDQPIDCIHEGFEFNVSGTYVLP